jgi:Protein of unknown function (DUF3891)
VIVQDTNNNGSRLAISMDEHLRTADQLRSGLNIVEFPIPEPTHLFNYIVRNHDVGWQINDNNPAIDPITNLPFSISTLPIQQSLEIGKTSVLQNLEHHPWCGFMVSLHMSGLYSGGFGLFKNRSIDHVPHKDLPAVQDFLDNELHRRQNLSELLRSNPKTADWMHPKMLWSSYVTLQFFDSMAVWLNLRRTDSDGEWFFPSLPRQDGSTCPVKVLAHGKNIFVTPWPFVVSVMFITFSARIARLTASGQWAMEETTKQTMKLCPG